MSRHHQDAVRAHEPGDSGDERVGPRVDDIDAEVRLVGQIVPVRAGVDPADVEARWVLGGYGDGRYQAVRGRHRALVQQQQRRERHEEELERGPPSLPYPGSRREGQGSIRTELVDIYG